MDEQWYGAVLEEYRSLRSEAVKAREAQLSILQLGIALVAALIGLGVTLKSEDIGSVLLSVIAPVMVGLTFELWIGEVRRSVRAGAFVAAIELRLAQRFREVEERPPMGWEMWLRQRRPQTDQWPRLDQGGQSQQEHDSLVLALVITGFLFIVAVASCAAGVHYLWHQQHAEAAYIVAAVMAVLFGLLVVRAKYAVKGIRIRHAPPPQDEVWPKDFGRQWPLQKADVDQSSAPPESAAETRN